MANKTSLGRFALSTANSTLSTVSKYQPKYVQSYYQSYIQPHIERADELGCRSLDLIQTKFPVVNQPTSELVRSVTGPSYQIVDGVKIRIYSSIKQPATHVAQEANKRLGSVVDNVEAVIDRYLPKIQETKREQEVQEVNQAVRAYYLFNDATLRFSQTVSEQVRATAAQLPRSCDNLARIASGQNLLDKATANIQNLQSTLVESVKLCTQSAQSHLPPSVNQRLQDLQATSHERLQLLTQQVSIQLSQVTEFLKVQSSPEWLKSRVTSLVDIANKQVELVHSQYTRNDISALEKAKNVAQGLQQQVLPILKTVQAQLTYYSEVARQKASQDLRVPFEYLGLDHAPKVATA
ncbi:uncharacterized protein B0P05DRAFT_531731 [Gilbertella persicaria]|uniref:uncharacterized protein n=1 Tax=Gilbertella persicaria TaxID=101096 RepID=UPI002220E69D|nr:uncharacterized protein B0P05DRAFT_531731 [Gilbertella persicaria]KAI8087639.1 hypothetical protein B0P05DRAFT_531731 [Gilbertella persicaria]